MQNHLRKNEAKATKTAQEISVYGHCSFSTTLTGNVIGELEASILREEGIRLGNIFDVPRDCRKENY